MTIRTARCACGRAEIIVEGEPVLVDTCHCDFCQRRSGNVFINSATFTGDQVLEITGETRCYNGLEVEGVGAPGIPGGINYRFCATCGSSLSFDLIYPLTGQRTFAIAVGGFVDADFPTPTMEFNTAFRHPWVPAVPGAHQFPGSLEDYSVPLEAVRQDGRPDPGAE